jgi:O-antigen biosynthesis protein WbqP
MSLKLNSMKRIFDLILALIILASSFIPLILIAIAVRLTSKGPAFHWSSRVGRYNQNFIMPKFRTMRLETPQVATHLLRNPKRYETPIGPFLRKTSLDELPQLYNIFRGDMSFVGPRPALFNQYDLIKLRTKARVHLLLPGITGWAQINGRDALSIKDKVNLDAAYLKQQSFVFDIKILCITILKVLKRDGISH